LSQARKGRRTGDVNIHKIPGRPSVKGAALRGWLPSQLKTNPDLTLKEHCEAFEDESGVEVSEATMSRNIRRLPGGGPLKNCDEEVLTEARSIHQTCPEPRREATSD
jgi:transposase